MGWGDDDVYLGESLRGMQDSVGSYSEIGAAQALARLKGAVGAGRFAGHAPVSMKMRSPYKDSTQIGISASGTFTATSWSGSALPTVSGLTRVYKSFKPTKAIIDEALIATYSHTTLGDTVQAVTVDNAADLLLVSAFAGADNCFPNAPTEANGISGLAFANNSLGNGISWPTINGGIDMTVGFAIRRTALYRIAAPAGYTFADLVSLEVDVRFNLLGPSLR